MKLCNGDLRSGALDNANFKFQITDFKLKIKLQLKIRFQTEIK